MATKKGSMEILLDNPKAILSGGIKAEVEPRTQLKGATGRPKTNPFAQDKKITYWIPEDLHRQLGFASIDQGKPKGQIVVEALTAFLKDYEGR